MFKRILTFIREKVRNQEYVVTSHARKEMTNEELTIYDVEKGILNGEIIERQRDKVTTEWKYRIKGKTVEDDEVEIITKISPTGKLVIITVYLL